MILYIPTSEAESILNLLTKHEAKMLGEAWLHDLKEQIMEQMRMTNIRTIPIEEVLKKQKRE